MTDSPIKGIPTVYRGITFRSRLEAKWAYMFDQFQWRWEYESTDLVGYIPDFILHFQEPVLAEIKPAHTLKECEQYVPKIIQSGWRGNALIFGNPLKLTTDSFMGPTCCYYGQKFGPEGDRAWGPGELFSCRTCGKTSIYHVDLKRSCIVNGCYEGNISPVDFDEIHNLWADAGEASRWLPNQEAA